MTRSGYLGDHLLHRTEREHQTSPVLRLYFLISYILQTLAKTAVPWEPFRNAYICRIPKGLLTDGIIYHTFKFIVNNTLCNFRLKNSSKEEVILKPIWTCGIELWRTAKNKILRTVVNAPWYVPNDVIHSNLQVTRVNDVIEDFSNKYRTRIKSHPNDLLSQSHEIKGLKRFKPTDLSTCFN